MVPTLLFRAEATSWQRRRRSRPVGDESGFYGRDGGMRFRCRLRRRGDGGGIRGKNNTDNGIAVGAVALADLFKHIGYTQVITISPICYHEMDLKSLN